MYLGISFWTAVIRRGCPSIFPLKVGLVFFLYGRIHSRAVAHFSPNRLSTRGHPIKSKWSSYGLSTINMFISKLGFFQTFIWILRPSFTNKFPGFSTNNDLFFAFKNGNQHGRLGWPAQSSGCSIRPPGWALGKIKEIARDGSLAT